MTEPITNPFTRVGILAYREHMACFGEDRLAPARPGPDCKVCPSVMIPKFVTELRNLNHTRFNSLVARSSLKFDDEFQGRDTSRRKPACASRCSDAAWRRPATSDRRTRNGARSARGRP